TSWMNLPPPRGEAQGRSPPCRPRSPQAVANSSVPSFRQLCSRTAAGQESRARYPRTYGSASASEVDRRLLSTTGVLAHPAAAIEPTRVPHDDTDTFEAPATAMRSRTAVRHRLSVMEARCLGARSTGSPKALV